VTLAVLFFPGTAQDPMFNMIGTPKKDKEHILWGRHTV
jgi:hypothetical protein